MLICLSRAFLLTCPPNATWLIDETIPTLTKDARTAVYKRAEEIVKQAFARQPSYDDLVPALLKLGIDKLATECTMRVGVPIKPMLETSRKISLIWLKFWKDVHSHVNSSAPLKTEQADFQIRWTTSASSFIFHRKSFNILQTFGTHD